MEKKMSLCCFCKVQKATVFSRLNTSILYCGEPCAQQDWKSANMSRRLFIQGKREREDEDMPCLNESDPFNMEEFKGMPKTDIIVIGQHCFHLPSLYMWVINHDNSENPLTRQPLTDLEKQSILDAAAEHYPLSVTLTWINGRKLGFFASSLDNVERVMSKAIRWFSDRNDLPDDTNLSIFQMLQHFTRTNISFAFIRPESLNIIQLIQARNNQLFSMGITKNLEIFVSERTSLESLEKRILFFSEFAQQQGYGTIVFDNKLAKIRKEIQDQRAYEQQAERVARRQRERLERFRRIPDLVEPPIPGYLPITVHFIALGGTFRVFHEPNARLMDIEDQIRSRIEGFIDIPPGAPLKFIFAGRYYDRRTPIQSISNFSENGNTLYVGF